MADTEFESADSRLAGLLTAGAVVGVLAFWWVGGSLLFRTGNAALAATLATAVGIVTIRVTDMVADGRE